MTLSGKTSRVSRSKSAKTAKQPHFTRASCELFQGFGPTLGRVAGRAKAATVNLEGRDATTLTHGCLRRIRRGSDRAGCHGGSGQCEEREPDPRDLQRNPGRGRGEREW